MCHSNIPFSLPGLTILRSRTWSNTLVVYARVQQPDACCPVCHTVSRSIHSRYMRTLRDLPISEWAVVLQLEVRRFRCGTRTCRRRTFVEQVPELMDRRARQTRRLNETIRAVGFTTSGEAGQGLMRHLRMPISADTLLRRVRQSIPPATALPQVIGIDDWAWRRGTRYGTIVVDLEAGTPIDLLPSRDREAVATWLQAHPTVTHVTRDGAVTYANAIREGAPNAVQIADRWHLLSYLRAAVERVLSG